VAKKASSKKAKSSAGRKTGAAAKKASKAPKKAARKVAKKAAGKSVKKVAKKATTTVKRGPIKSPLSKAELKEFRKMLLAKRRDLVGDMNGIEAEALRRNRQDGTGDLSNLPTHPADIGTDNYEQEFTLGLLESERVLLEEIDQALQRIDNGTFGVCLGTGEPINPSRLKARPWAKYCIEYARMLEKGLVRRDSDREAAIAGFDVDEDEEDSYEETEDYSPDDEGNQEDEE